MNTGTLSIRYARALLAYTEQNGSAERVCSQIESILTDPDKAKMQLEPDLCSFVGLLKEHGRLDILTFTFNSFVKLYYESIGVRVATLVTAAPAPGFDEKVKKMLEERTGFRIVVRSSVNPDLVGGFVLDVDNYRLDASTSHQLDVIRRQFEEINKRLV